MKKFSSSQIRSLHQVIRRLPISNNSTKTAVNYLIISLLQAKKVKVQNVFQHSPKITRFLAFFLDEN